MALRLQPQILIGRYGLSVSWGLAATSAQYGSSQQGHSRRHILPSSLRSYPSYVLRILDKKPSQFNIRVRDAKAGRATPEEGYKATEEEIAGYPGNHPDPGYRQTIGWQPTCKCNADKVPSIALDPFLGTGTTLWEAKLLGRRGVGYELSEKYCALSLDRNRQMVMELTS